MLREPSVFFSLLLAYISVRHQKEAELLLNLLDEWKPLHGIWGWLLENAQDDIQESHMLWFEGLNAGLNIRPLSIISVYCSWIRLLCQCCEGRWFDWSMSSEKGSRELRWKGEAGANQLWFSVSCWDLHRERSCSCSLERSVKPKKCTPTIRGFHNFSHCKSSIRLLFFPCLASHLFFHLLSMQSAFVPHV